MSVQALDIPDDPARLPAWLEQQLVGFRLAELVGELSLVHGSPPGPALREVLGARLEPVLAGGLRALPAPVLRHLLARPRLLLDLQELVFTEGGPYWDEVSQPAVPEARAVLERGRRRLEAAARAPAGTGPSGRAGVARWGRRLAVAGLAAAAAVLLGVVIADRLNPPAAGWGWNRPGALAQDRSAAAYLRGLAAAAGEWFDRRPEDRAALARRILQFRQGCATLIFAPHAPLAEPDRRWLRERCRAWAKKLDEELEALEAGQSVARVRDATDQVVTRLIDALRTRAGQVVSAAEGGRPAARPSRNQSDSALTRRNERCATGVVGGCWRSSGCWPRPAARCWGSGI